MEKPHLLIVDDDDRLRGLLKKFLRDQGFMVTAAASGAQARLLLGWFLFDLVILDVMMPVESGLEVLAWLHPQQPEHPPVLMLSAMGEGDDRVKGLEAGAEDYLVKPFEPKELVLRIRAILRRTHIAVEKARSVHFGDFRFDLATGQLRRGGDSVPLTAGEQAMLKLLVEHAGQPVSREALARAMPGAGNERSIDVQVTRLRKKIEESDGKPLYLQTVRGAGYVLYAEAPP